MRSVTKALAATGMFFILMNVARGDQIQIIEPTAPVPQVGHIYIFKGPVCWEHAPIAENLDTFQKEGLARAWQKMRLLLASPNFLFPNPPCAIGIFPAIVVGKEDLDLFTQGNVLYQPTIYLVGQPQQDELITRYTSVLVPLRGRR